MDVWKYSVILQWTLILILILTTLRIWWIFSKKYDYWKNRGIPYLKPLLFVGNLIFVMRKSAWDFFFELWKKYPRDYVGIFLAWKPVLVVQSPDLIKNILVKDADHFQDRFLYSDYKSDPLGSLNLFTVKNPIWSEMRHELSPIFTSARLKVITELMNINSLELVRKIERDYIGKKETVNLKKLFTMYTSDTVAYSVFGLRMSVLSDQLSPLWHITSHMVKWNFWRGLEFTSIFFVPSLAKKFRLQFFSAGATEFIKKLFWNVAKDRKNSAQTNDKDLVNHLLKLKDNLRLPAGASAKFADDLMLAQAAVFILGSVETSSTTLSYCLHELAYHPDVQLDLSVSLVHTPHKQTSKRHYPESFLSDFLKRLENSFTSFSKHVADITLLSLLNEAPVWIMELWDYFTKPVVHFFEKLYNEINDALTHSGEDILQYNDLMELKYLSACIYETLRKYPPVPYLERMCNKTYKLNDEVTIEKGVPVFVNVVAVHYDERHYPEPNEWRPERPCAVHDNDNLNYTFIPFGEGPRFCIGKRYGMMQIRAALAQLLHKYKVEPGSETYEVQSDPYSVILSPQGGGSVRFVPR